MTLNPWKALFQHVPTPIVTRRMTVAGGSLVYLTLNSQLPFSASRIPTTWDIEQRRKYAQEPIYNG